jgi:hypothetical protein
LALLLLDVGYLVVTAVAGPRRVVDRLRARWRLSAASRDVDHRI